MKDKIHLFFVGNFFHFVLSHSIIGYKKLDISRVYFITYRGFKLPSYYSSRFLFDKDKFGVEDVIKNINDFKELFENMEICAYSAFQFTYPLARYFSEYFFFEEGASALRSRQYIIADFRDILREIMFHFQLFLKIGLGNNNIKGLCHGTSFFSPFPFKTTLFKLSDESYTNFLKSSCKKIKIPICSFSETKKNIHDSIIIVMDRIINIGRPCDLDIYMSVLKDFLISHNFLSKSIYLKLHPADFINPDALQIIYNSLDFFNYEVIDYGLEDIAMSDMRNIFLGSNSTVLYYAPIFGGTNRSISFARQLAQRDTIYNDYLNKAFGGVEGFCEIFGKNVEIR